MHVPKLWNIIEHNSFRKYARKRRDITMNENRILSLKCFHNRRQQKIVMLTAEIPITYEKKETVMGNETHTDNWKTI